MKTSAIYYISTAVLLGAAGAAVADDMPALRGATSVAEMLQLRQEHQLREQLVKAGHWDEVRKLDAIGTARAQAQREQLNVQFNEQFSDKHVDNVLANQCDSEEITAPKSAPHHAESIVSNDGH